MADSRFFKRQGPFTLSALAELTGAKVASLADGDRLIHDVAPLDRADAENICFLDNPKYAESLGRSRGGACFMRDRYLEEAPAGMAVMLTDDPYRCYALTAQQFYPVNPVMPGIQTSLVDPSAVIAVGVSIGPGAVIGRNVEIGEGTAIGANAVIDEGVKIGANTRIGALCSISHAYVGSRVIIHRGVHIGQDGFGFAMNREGHVKVPQLGRVMIEDDVEIGAGTTIDRGTGPDTMIGRGAKIDNLVQIGHNVQIGALAVIVAQTGIAGSTRIGDGAVLGGQAGISGHLKIGPGVRIAAKSGVMTDIPAGANYGGSPAVPIKEWHRQTIALSRMARTKRSNDE